MNIHAPGISLPIHNKKVFLLQAIVAYATRAQTPFPMGNEELVIFIDAVMEWSSCIWHREKERGIEREKGG